MDSIEQKIRIGEKKYKIRLRTSFAEDSKEYRIYFDHEQTLFGLLNILPFEFNDQYVTWESTSAESIDEAMNIVEQLIMTQLEKNVDSKAHRELEQEFNGNIADIADNLDDVEMIN